MEDVEKGNQLTGNISSPSTIPSLPFTRYLYQRKTFRKAHEKKKSKRFKNTRPSQPSTLQTPATPPWKEGVGFARHFDVYTTLPTATPPPIPTTTSNEQTPLQISCPSPPPPAPPPPPPPVLLF